MFKITIELNEDEIARQVEEEVAARMVKEYCSEQRDTKMGIRKGVENAVKAYVYDQKEMIIERCVDRAADSIARKGLPMLLERMIKQEGAEHERD